MNRTILASLSSLFVCAACGGSQPAPEAAPPPAPSAEMPPPASAAAAAAPSASAPAEAAKPPEAPPAPKSVTVDFVAKSGSKLTGKATLTEEGTGVKVVLSVEGISPGEHGAHIHEAADCSAPDAKSAGGHYNPDKHDHGLPAADAAKRHLGDLGNLVVGKDGKGTLEIVVPDANLKPGDPHSFIGRGIIIHEKKDDGGQPVGNAGGRIGCAAIQ
ncbi:MAG TPA: superoxide dismutase family protein [Polyangiaceae bacterium]|nr:superoxide dismutase family protein [Polyangiaceae bacterium]